MRPIEERGFAPFRQAPLFARVHEAHDLVEYIIHLIVFALRLRCRMALRRVPVAVVLTPFRYQLCRHVFRLSISKRDSC